MQLLIESKPRPPSTTPAPFPCTTDLHAYVKPDPGILDVSQFGNVLRLETITLAGMITDGATCTQLAFFLCQMCKTEGGWPLRHAQRYTSISFNETASFIKHSEGRKVLDND